MAIKARDVPIVLVERIEVAHPAPATFSVDDTVDWPVDVLPALLRQGVVVAADRTNAITCPGCEWQCHKRVVVRRVGRTSRAFIMCDEEPDHGRIPVQLDILAVYTADLRGLGLFVAGALDIGPPKVSRNLAAYALGVVKGRHGERHVIVAMEDGHAVLGVGEQRKPMVRALIWGASGLGIDAGLVHRLADRKAGKATGQSQYAPDRSRQDARKSTTRKRDVAILREASKFYSRGGMTWSQAARAIAKTKSAGGLSPETIRRIITKQRGIERKNLRSKPKTRK